MKAFFLVLSLSIVQSISFAQDKQIDWMTWDEAVAASAEEPRLIFVDVYTEWCGWCKRMDASTFAHPVISEYMSKHYYSVKLDAEMKDTVQFNGYTFVNPNPKGKRSPHQLAVSLLDQRMSYPSFVVLTPNFERLQILPGYKGASDFEPIIRYFVEGASQGIPYEEYMASFQTLFPAQAPQN
jgi:thioredoxin-related protein